MNTFLALVFCGFVCFSETLPLLSVGDELNVDDTIADGSPYPAAPCSFEKTISELKALSDTLCDEHESLNTNIDYWVAMCNCAVDKSFPCPHCSVSIETNGGDTTESEHEDYTPSTLNDAKKSTTRTIYRLGRLNLNQEHYSHNYGILPHHDKELLMPVPQKRGGNHTHSNNFIRFG